MMKFKNQKTVLMFLFTVCCTVSIISLRTPKPQKDCGFVQNVYGQRISWKDSYPVLVTIDPSVPNALRPAIFRAAAKWEIQAGKKLFRFQEPATHSIDSNPAIVSGPAKDKKNIIYFLKNWDSNIKAEQARTSVYWVGDSIQEADIRVNGEQFAYYIEDSKKILYSNIPEALQIGMQMDVVKESQPENFGVSYSQDFSSRDEDKYRFQGPLVGYNFEALMLHELGHFLGLKHRDLGDSVMATYLAAQTDRVVLSEADVRNLNCEYGLE